MPAKRNLKPQTPGAQVDNSQLPPQDGEVEETVDVVEEAVETEADEEITIKKSDLEAMVAGMVEKQVVTEVKAARRRTELASRVDDRENLPDQKDVDATKISRAVLTKQGWVCPIVHQSDRLRMERNQSIPS
jgi:hypothetical protein